MKTLQNRTLIYDKDCPMCNVYSQGFIKAGMLDKNGRQAFSELSEFSKKVLDLHRSKNEIALVNTTDQSVSYGLESLLIIIGNSFPTLEKIARFPFLYWFFQKLYKFVSYNRKQIIPSKNDYSENACVPDFNLKYRLVYIAFVVLISSFVLSIYNRHLFPDFKNNFQLELFICFMQIAWQTLFFKNYLEDKFWNYLGNLMTVSLIGTLLLIPALWFNFSQLFYFIYFGIVVFIMFLEHLRRCKLLNIGFLPTLSWMLFRVTFGAVLVYIVTY